MANAFPMTSNRDMIFIQQNNAIDAITNAITVSYLRAILQICIDLLPSLYFNRMQLKMQLLMQNIFLMTH